LTNARLGPTIARTDKEVAGMVEHRARMEAADPYLLFGLLGKRVIHPGGRKATEQLLAQADPLERLRSLEQYREDREQ
jgi:hypothetical protein